MNCELISMRKEAVVAYFKVLSQNFREEAEENYEHQQSG